MGLSPESREAKQFRLGLRDLGYTEGRDVVLEWRSAKGDYHRVPELVADLIQSKVDVIVQDSTVGTEITKRATSTVPIVMALVLDPLGSGLVRALASPGGNVTGLSMMATDAQHRAALILRLPQERRQVRPRPLATFGWRPGIREVSEVDPYGWYTTFVRSWCFFADQGSNTYQGKGEQPP